MHAARSASAGRWPFSRRATVVVVVIYLLSAGALWWKYPPSPRLVIHAGPLAQFAGFSPDGKWLLTNEQPPNASKTQPSGQQLFVRFWNVETGQPGVVVGSLPNAQLGFTPDGKRLFVDSTYYDVATGKPLPENRYVNRTLLLPPVVSPDEKVVAETGYRTIDVRDTETSKSRFTVKPAHVAAFRPDGHEFAVAIDPVEGEPIPTGPLRYQLKFFDPQSGEEQRALPETAGRVRFMAYSAAGDKIAVILWTGGEKGVFQGAAQIWNLKSGQVEHTLPLESEVVAGLQSMQFVRDGRVVLAYGMFRTLLWDSTGPAADQLVGPGKLNIFSPIVSADFRLVAWWDDGRHELVVRRLGDGKSELMCRQNHSDPRVAIMPLAITPDNRVVANIVSPQPSNLWESLTAWLGTWRYQYAVFDAETGRVFGGIPERTRTTVAGITPDGRTLVSRDFNHDLRDEFTLWDVPAGEPWLAILGLSLVPAALVGWLLRWRQRKLSGRSVTAVAAAE